MHAFNKRFRPKVWKGYPVISWLLAGVGVLFSVFAWGSYAMAKLPPVAIALGFMALLMMYFAFEVHRNVNLMRIRSSLFTGRNDVVAKVMEDE